MTIASSRHKFRAKNDYYSVGIRNTWRNPSFLGQ